MKYKLYINQKMMDSIKIIMCVLIMATHKITGYGFLGFTLAIILIIENIEINSFNENIKNK